MDYRYCVIVGTRAELIKMAPILRELDARKLNYIFIHTGQHNFGDMLEQFNLKKPDLVLYEPPKKSSLFMNKIHKSLLWGIIVNAKLLKFYAKNKVKYVLVHGDTVSTLLGAFAAILVFFRNIKIVHIEAGLRSKKLFEPFPEELVRRIVDFFSKYLFLPSKEDYENVKKYSRKKIIISGNTIVDSIDFALNSKYLVKEKRSNYVLISIHRYENLNVKERLVQVVKFITYIADKYKETIIWPMHDNTLAKLKELGLYKQIEDRKNINITEQKNYFEFIKMSAKSKYLIADGGSIQEEAVYLKKPAFLLRKYTERVAGLKNKYNILTKLDFYLFKKQLDNFYRAKLRGNEELVYGMPLVSKKIINILEKGE